MNHDLKPLAFEFHVSPKGDDQNPGTDSRPFATLMRAREAVRAAKVQGVPKPVKVVVHGGVYVLDETLTLDRRDSGTQDAPVLWCAAPGEGPIISGGAPVGGWVTHEGSILKAPAPERIAWHGRPRQLFYRGQRQRRARWPKPDAADPAGTGWAFPEGPVEDFGRTAFRFRPGTFPRRWRKPTQAEVNIYAGTGWCKTIIPLLSVDHDERIVRLAYEPFKADRQPWYMEIPMSEHNRFYVENVLEELTEPGEWCYDSSEGALYFWPPEELFDESAVVVPVLDCLVRLRNMEWLTLEGLTFTCTTTGDDYHPLGVQGLSAMAPQQGRRYCGEAVHLRGTRHCCVRNCTFDQVGGNAVYLERDNFRGRIERNTVAYAGANGVVLAGDRAFHPLFCEVTDNEVHHAGCIINYVAGVFLGLSDGCLVAHNYLHDLPHHAVNLASNGVGRNYVECNEIRRVCLEIADTGAINSWMEVPGPWIEVDAERSGHVIRDNLIVDVPGCNLEDGRLAPDWTTRGIYLDNYTSNCLVTGNVIVRAGMGFQIHAGKHNLVENNVVVDCKIGLHGCDWVSTLPGNDHMKVMFRGNRFRRNVFVSAYPDAFPYSFHAWTDYIMERCDENVLFLPKAPQYAIDWKDRADGLQRSTYEEWQGMGFDTHSVLADPLFAAPEKEDFRFRDGSPALALGIHPPDMARAGIRKREVTG